MGSLELKSFRATVKQLKSQGISSGTAENLAYDLLYKGLK